MGRKLAVKPRHPHVFDRHRFRKGSEVEVCSKDDGFRGAWYEAVVVRLTGRRFQNYEVAYASLHSDNDPETPLHEIVLKLNIRPRPPPPSSPGTAADSLADHPLAIKYARYDLVEAFHNDGWWAAVVSEALPQTAADRRYKLCFPTSREEIEIEESLMRPQLHWVRHRWITTQELETVDEPPISAGDAIEVIRDIKKYGPAWFAANLLKVVCTTTFEIEYKDLKAKDDDKMLMTEILDIQYMRPLLPLASETKNFTLDDQVEVFHNGGWSPAVVWKTLGNSKYLVNLKHKNINMKVVCPDMRPLRSWDCSQWDQKKQDKTKRSLALAEKKSISRRKKSAGKKDNPISVPTSSDDGEVVFEPHSDALCLKRKRPDGSNPEDHIKSSQLKKLKLQGDIFVPENSLELEHDSITPKTVIDNCAENYTEENRTALVEEQHLSENPSRNISAISSPTKNIMPVQSSTELHAVKESCLVNTIPELPSMDQVDFSSLVEEQKHSSRSNCTSKSPINGKSSRIDHKGTRSSRISPSGGRKKLTMQPDQRQKICLQNTGEKLLLQDETSPGTEDKSLEKRISDIHVQCDVGIDTTCGGQQDELSKEGTCGRQQGELSKDECLTIDICSVNGANDQPEKFKICSLTPRYPLVYSRSSSIDCSTSVSLSDMRSCSLRTRMQGVSTLPSRNSANILMSSENLQENNGALQPKPSLEISPAKAISLQNELALIDTSLDGSPLKNLGLPFTKNSSMWKPIESIEVFQLMPQQPHFSPLEQYSLEFREGMAVGLMVSFANLVSSIKSLHIRDAQTIIEEKLSALEALEAHGFCIEPVHSRLQKLLEMQIRQKRCENIKASAEANILKKREGTVRLDASIVPLYKAIKDLEEEIANLREQGESINDQIKLNEFEISKLQIDMQEADESYHSLQKQFSTALTAPW